MEKEELFFSSLSVAREFEPADRQVRFTRELDWLLEQSRESGLVTLKNERVRCRNALEWTIVRDAKNQRVVDAARSLQNSAAASAPAQDWNAVCLAKWKIGFGCRLVRITDHDKVTRRLPNSQQLKTWTCFC